MTDSTGGVEAGQATDPRGSVFVQLDVEGRWAVSLLTEGWSDAEKAALCAGEKDAREALKDAAIERVMKLPDDVEARYVELDVNGETVRS